MRPNQLVATLAYDGRKAEQKIAQTVDKFVKGADTIDRKWAITNRRVVERFKSARASADVFTRELAKQTKQLNALRGSLDPVFAATQRFEQQQELLNQAFKRGDLTGEEYKRLLSLVQAELDLVSSATTRAAAGVETVTRASGRGTAQIQNFAFQVGDAAVQIGSGTSASIALGQQLPQLLGGFGALGAVLGAVVAVGIPLSRVLLGTGESAVDLDESIEALTSTIDDYSVALANAQTPTQELAEKYGAAAEAARQFFGVFEAQAQAAAQTALSDSIDALALKFGEAALEISANFGTLRAAQENQIALFDQAAEAARNADRVTSAGLDNQAVQLGNLINEVQDYAKSLGISGEELIALSNAAQNLQLAEAVEDTVAAAQALDTILGSVQGRLEDEGGALAEIRGKLAEIGIEAVKFEAELEKSQFTSENLSQVIDSVSGGLDAAASVAARLSSNLGDAAVNAFNAARALAAARDQQISAGPDGAVNDVRESLTPNGTDRDDIVAQITRPARTSSRSSGRRSGGRRGRGRSDADLEATAEREIRRLKLRIRELGKTRSEVAGLRAEYRLLEEARRKGIDLDARASESGKTARQVISETADEVRKLSDQYEQTSMRQTEFKARIDSISDAFADTLTSGKSFREGMRDIFNQIASDFVSSGIRGLFSTLVSGGGTNSGGGGGFGGFIRDLLSFEGGGFTGTGARSGGVDGRGGFPAILHPNETVIDHTRASASGAMTITVNHQWNFATNGDASVREIIRSQMPMIEQRTTAAVQEATRRNQIRR